MLEKVKKYIDDKQLLNPSSTVVVGVSGGMDSMALLDILTLLSYRCIAAHCNFHLRGEESDRDAEFVKNWCKNVDIEFTSVDFDTLAYARDKKISIEMAARELRYQWFEIVRQKYEAEVIAVAHHRDDAIETVLLNLLRGTGIKGLTGISPKKGNIVRPLLCVSRNEIEQYLNERNIPFVTDSTNYDDTITRNYLRLNVIPMLEKLNPSAKNAIFRTSQNVGEAYHIYEDAIEKLKKEVMNGEKISIEKLKNTPSPVSVLFEILSSFGFNSSVVEDIIDNLDTTSGKVFFSERYQVIKDRQYLLLSKISDSNNFDTEIIIYEGMTEILYPIHLKINVVNINSIEVNKSGRFLLSDAEKVRFPLKLRKWKEGDWFVPFGMKGKKKLSDYFTDCKFDLLEKERQWILESDGRIVWIVGKRNDERFKVSDHTNNVLMIEWVE
ncbi:MAG: tRNA(Ile)-lysidine synthase [Bacteroidetes bacterium ADurb.BinA261]|jgi:tRNA(Ile)-lysidine synthase|nr:MAG: tRNA(Ile)-lysidine synthase [Bacteroidetes bacterium ADurb.BinA261]